MSRGSTLHIPKPTARPGEEPDFSYLDVSPAGKAKKPATDASARDIEDLAFGMVRVLDDEHKACGEWDPGLSSEQLSDALRLITLTRVFDERMHRMQRQGRISFYMQSLGEEAISAAQGMALDHGDMLFPSYRNQALYIHRGLSLVDMMCQCLSNTKDMCKGRQMPIMYHHAKGNIFSISGNLATQYPQAVGWAMAAAIKGETDIA
ncbi:MAG: thiamine pyrophosphate-dependent enzyme, partial [Pseudomonadota bacterium]